MLMSAVSSYDRRRRIDGVLPATSVESANALRHRLMDPTLFKELIGQMNRLHMEGRASIHAAEAEQAGRR